MTKVLMHVWIKVDRGDGVTVIKCNCGYIPKTNADMANHNTETEQN